MKPNKKINVHMNAHNVHIYFYHILNTFIFLNKVFLILIMSSIFTSNMIEHCLQILWASTRGHYIKLNLPYLWLSQILYQYAVWHVPNFFKK